MLYIDRIDDEDSKVYIYDSDEHSLYAVALKSSKVKSCVNYIKDESSRGYSDDPTCLKGNSMLLFNSENASAVCQVSGGNRILYVYSYGQMHTIDLAGNEIHINDEAIIKVPESVHSLYFRYAYHTKTGKSFGFTLIDRSNGEVHQFLFNSTGKVHYNGKLICLGYKVSLKTFRRKTLLTSA